MKGIIDYLKGLIPSFETSALLNNIDNLIDGLSKFIQPSLRTLLSVLTDDWKYTDKLANELMETVGRESKLPGYTPRTPPLKIIDLVISNMYSTLGFIRSEIDKSSGDVIATTGITYSKANLLQYCEVATFFVQYTNILINYVSAAELNSIVKGPRVKGIAPHDVEWLRANRWVYIVALRIMSYDVNELKKQLNKIPDMTIDPATDTDAKIVVGASNLDPFGFADLPFPISVIYNFRLRGVNSEAEEIEAARAQLNAIQYRVMLMQQLIDNGQGDASMEQQLQKAEDRMLEQRRKLAKLEERHGFKRI